MELNITHAILSCSRAYTISFVIFISKPPILHLLFAAQMSAPVYRFF